VIASTSQYFALRRIGRTAQFRRWVYVVALFAREFAPQIRWELVLEYCARPHRPQSRAAWLPRPTITTAKRGRFLPSVRDGALFDNG
jgi:hypothetical protein